MDRPTISKAASELSNRTEAGRDVYTLSETGTAAGGAFSQGVVGTDNYTGTDASNSAAQTDVGTTTGGGTWTRTSSGPGSTLAAGSGTNAYVLSTAGNAIAGVFGQSETGTDRYRLVQKFDDASNATSGQTPGNVTFHSHGLMFRDPNDSDRAWYWPTSMLPKAFGRLLDASGDALIIDGKISGGETRQRAGAILKGVGQSMEGMADFFNPLLAEETVEGIGQRYSDLYDLSPGKGYSKFESAMNAKTMLALDFVGVIGLYEAAEGTDVISGAALDTNERWTRATKGGIALGLAAAPLKSLKGAPKSAPKGAKLPPAGLPATEVAGKPAVIDGVLRTGRLENVRTPAEAPPVGVESGLPEPIRLTENLPPPDPTPLVPLPKLPEVRGIARSSLKLVDSPSCFPAGVPLRTPTGSKRVEEFVAGDEVLSRDESDPAGDIAPKVVEEVFRRFAPCVDLRIGGQTIRTTAEHPFWVEHKGWCPVSELQVGDRLLTLAGDYLTVEGKTELDEWKIVYNLRVADWHTYFVGRAEWGFSVWAHNAECAILYQKPNGQWVLKGQQTGKILAQGIEAEALSAAKAGGHEISIPQAGEPLSLQHRASGWQAYQDSFNPGGKNAGKTPWTKDHWDNMYDVNMTRATVANGPVIDYHNQLGWGRRQVTVETPVELGQYRKLDIADVKGKRGVEVKTGDVYLRAEIKAEIARDAWLIKERGWDISYHFAPGATASPSVLSALKDAGIRVTGLK